MLNDSVYGITENKLILLFILNKTTLPLTNAQITELVMKDSLMNYFLLQQYLSELISTNLILIYEKDERQIYKLTDKGAQTLSYFESRIPDIIKEKVVETISTMKYTFKQSEEVISNYFPQSKNDYLVECKIVENGTSLIELKLTVGTKAEAKDICDYWKKDSTLIYPKIISLLALNNENKDL